jgi:hypothetical protein
MAVADAKRCDVRVRACLCVRVGATVKRHADVTLQTNIYKYQRNFSIVMQSVKQVFVFKTLKPRFQIMVTGFQGVLQAHC